MVGANGMMMSAEEWYDVGNYEIKDNAFPQLTCLASHPRSCMSTNFISSTERRFVPVGGLAGTGP